MRAAIRRTKVLVHDDVTELPIQTLTIFWEILGTPWYSCTFKSPYTLQARNKISAEEKSVIMWLWKKKESIIYADYIMH